ncbi:MAG TPA: hypothetical protein VF459_02705 [Caulobacteraceae bacterium]
MVQSSVILLLLTLAAAPALVQDEEEPDAIGAVLSNSQHPPSQTQSGPVFTIPPTPPRAMPTANAPPPPTGAPRLEQTGVSPDGPASYGDMAFESRIRQSVAAAQGLQGALDGQWTLYDAAGHPLYVFMFIDPAGGRGDLEAAWRDLRRARGSDDLGVVDSLQHTGLSLSLNFVPHRGAGATAIQLQGQATGAWDGQMTEAGAALKVSLRRN